MAEATAALHRLGVDAGLRQRLEQPHRHGVADHRGGLHQAAVLGRQPRHARENQDLALVVREFCEALLQDRLLLEAKRLMLYSNMTVAEAAYYLGFDDPAYFSRFFVRGCKVSPRQFRRLGGEPAVDVTPASF